MALPNLYGGLSMVDHDTHGEPVKLQPVSLKEMP
jgi:hypothetical protein